MNNQTAAAIPLTWKTGQHVPVSGNYADQYGKVSWHDEHHTFPPCIGRQGECAYRAFISR